MNKKISNLDEKVSDIDKRVSRLEEKVDKIIELLGGINKNCDKMSNHINFVESIYEQIKRPFHFVMDKVNSNLIAN